MLCSNIIYVKFRFKLLIYLLLFGVFYYRTKDFTPNAVMIELVHTKKVRFQSFSAT